MNIKKVENISAILLIGIRFAMARPWFHGKRKWIWR